MIVDIRKLSPGELIKVDSMVYYKKGLEDEGYGCLDVPDHFVFLELLRRLYDRSTVFYMKALHKDRIIFVLAHSVMKKDIVIPKDLEDLRYATYSLSRV